MPLIEFVTLGTLEMELHVLMQLPLAGTVIVIAMPVARGTMVSSFARVLIASLEMVLPAVT